MATSSIYGGERAPAHPSGRGSDRLGPSDNSDSGSDAMGTREARADSDASGTGERGAVFGADAREGGDILPDRIVDSGDGDGSPDASDSEDITDIAADEDADETDDQIDR